VTWEAAKGSYLVEELESSHRLFAVYEEEILTLEKPYPPRLIAQEKEELARKLSDCKDWKEVAIEEGKKET